MHECLPEYLKQKAELYFSEQEDPMFVEYDAYDVFVDHINEYEYFLFLEDDVLLTDSWFLEKIKKFNYYSPYKNYVLTPHRFEYANGIKHYFDQAIIDENRSTSYTYSEKLKVSFDDVSFSVFQNPHAAIYCLSKEQINLWIESGYKWRNKVVAFGVLESAATFSLYENFEFFKPHPDNIGYLEVQHYGNKYMLKAKHYSSLKALMHLNRDVNSYSSRAVFFLRFSMWSRLKSLIYKKYWQLLGMKIGKQTRISKMNVLWPHKISIGDFCSLETNVVFTFNGPWMKGISIQIKDNIFIGRGCEFNINCGIIINSYSNISSGCKFIDHDHGIKLDELIGPQPAVKKEIIIEEDVWLGVNVVVLKGVIIGRGAVVGAGAVITKSIPPNEIWGGVPAKKIGIRTI